MTVVGQSRRFRDAPKESGSPPEADMAFDTLDPRHHRIERPYGPFSCLIELAFEPR